MNETYPEAAFDRPLFEELYGAHPEAIVWLKPVWNDAGTSIEDFEFTHSNPEGYTYLRLKPEQLAGLRISNTPTLTDHLRSAFMEELTRVYLTGEVSKTKIYNPALNKYALVLRMRLRGGVLTVVEDRTEENLAIQKLEKNTRELEEQKTIVNKVLYHSSNGISVGAAVRDANGQVVDFRAELVNDAAVRFLGISKYLYLSKSGGELDPNFPGSEYFRQCVWTLESGEPFITHYHLEAAGRWFEVTVSKMDYDHLIHIFTDVTTTKSAQLIIEQSMQRLEAVFNAAQSGMFTFSPVRDDSGDIVDFRFVITNTNFAAYVGQTPQILKGALGSTWFPGYLHNGVFDMYKTTFLTGETLRRDVHYHVDGHDLYLDLMSRKVGEEVLVTFNDYTPLKKAQFQLEKYVAELERSNRNLEEFAHAASHDLKEPVRKIRIFTDLLKGSLGALSSEQQHLFSRVENATKRMAMLIDDLLEYSHVNMGMDLVEEISLNKKVALVLSDLEVAIQEKGARITVGDLPKIKGHRRQWQQLFHNLIENALKYSKQDIAPEITITAEEVTGKTSAFDLGEDEQNKSFYLIQVRDNGIGFDPEHAELIFQVFKRLHGKGVYSGSGVGLAIVRKVVENHDGYIKAESELGKGATFKVLLPY